jgi:hypothetical protein
MKHLKNWFKKLRLRQVLTVFLGATLLFVSTACSGGATATTSQELESARESMVQGNTPDDAINGRSENLIKGKTSDELRPDIPSDRATSVYEGGMNKYPDIDPRRDTSTAGAKAQGLVENAEEQVIDQTGSIGENVKRTLDQKAENLQRSGRNQAESLQSLPSKAKDTAEDVAEGTKKGTRNLKENVEDAAEDVTQAGKEATKPVKRAAEDTADAVKQQANEASKSTKRALEDTADALK